MNTYPKKFRLVVSLTTGESIQGKTIVVADENEEERWGEILRKPKDLSYLALVQENAFGDEDTIYFNPTYITHIRVIDVKPE